MLKMELEKIDTVSPLEYNMGRNQGSAFAFSKNNRFVLKVISASNFYHFKRVFCKDYFKLV